MPAPSSAHLTITIRKPRDAAYGSGLLQARILESSSETALADVHTAPSEPVTGAIYVGSPESMNHQRPEVFLFGRDEDRLTLAMEDTDVITHSKVATVIGTDTFNPVDVQEPGITRMSRRILWASAEPNSVKIGSAKPELKLAQTVALSGTDPKANVAKNPSNTVAQSSMSAANQGSKPEPPLQELASLLLSRLTTSLERINYSWSLSLSFNILPTVPNSRYTGLAISSLLPPRDIFSPIHVAVIAPAGYMRPDVCTLVSQVAEDLVQQCAQATSSSEELETAIVLRWLLVCIRHTYTFTSVPSIRKRDLPISSFTAAERSSEIAAITSLVQLIAVIDKRFQLSGSRDDFQLLAQLIGDVLPRLATLPELETQYHPIEELFIPILVRGRTRFGTSIEAEDLFWRCHAALASEPQQSNLIADLDLFAIGGSLSNASILESANRAIVLTRAQVDATPDMEFESGSGTSRSSKRSEEQLKRLALYLLLRSKIGGSLEDANEAVDIYQQIVARKSKAVGEHQEVLCAFELRQLAQCLLQRSRVLAGGDAAAGEPRDADRTEAFRILRHVLELCPPSNRHSVPATCELARALMDTSVKVLAEAPSTSEHMSDELEALRTLRSALRSLSSYHTDDKIELLTSVAEIVQQCGRRHAAELPALDEDQEVFLGYDIVTAREAGYEETERCCMSVSPEYWESCILASFSVDQLESKTKAGATPDNVEMPLVAALVLLYLDRNFPTCSPPSGLALLRAVLENEGFAEAYRLQIFKEALPAIAKFGPTHECFGEVCELLKAATGLLPRLVDLGDAVNVRLDAVRAGRGIAIVAALHLLAGSRFEEATELLETGRSVFWQQALRLRTKMDGVPADLRQRLVLAAKELENHGLGKLDEGARVERRYMDTVYKNLVAEVRQLPGLERFMLPYSTEELLSVTRHGPVVILVPCADFSIALVLQPASDNTSGPHIHGMKLEVSLKELRKLSGMLGNATGTARGDHDSTTDSNLDAGHSGELVETPANGSAGSEQSDLHTRAGRRGAQTTGVAKLLEVMWVKITNPIIQYFSYERKTGRERPRLWWCPTQEFMFLPIHAAGVYSKKGFCCSDYVVSSYTPTLSALLQARAAYRPSTQADLKVLLAAVPRPFRGTPLEGTIRELQTISPAIPPECHISLPATDDVLTNPAPEAGASVSAMVDALPDTAVLHLACHGVQNTTNPLESGFLMRDNILTISTLMSLALPKAFFAFLSACETAKGDIAQADEAIHLAAAMLFVGFKSVIGTMWLMNDADGPHVAKRVYEQLFGSDVVNVMPDIIPYALDDAVRDLREKGASPERWALFVHFGI